MVWIIKNPNLKSSKKPNEMHEFMHENKKENTKRRVKWTYRLGERKTLQKDRSKMTKKWRFAFIESYGERKGRKLFEKVFGPSKNLVLKNVPHNFWLIETLGSIDRNRQRLTQKFWINFDWSKNSLDQSKFQKNHSFEKKKPSFCIKSSKHWKIWVKCMSMRCKVFQKHKF